MTCEVLSLRSHLLYSYLFIHLTNNLKNTMSCNCNNQVQSWYDLPTTEPMDPRDLIANVTLGVGTTSFSRSTNFLQTSGRLRHWHLPDRRYVPLFMEIISLLSIMPLNGQ